MRTSDYYRVFVIGIALAVFGISACTQLTESERSEVDVLVRVQEMENSAAAHLILGQNLEAESLYLQEIELLKRAFGPNNLYLILPLHNLASLHEKAWGPDDPGLAWSLRKLGIFYYSRDDFEEAKPYFERALAIKEKELGPDHLDVSMNLTSLAEVYFNLNQFEQAEPLYKRTLAILESTLSPDHPPGVSEGDSSVDVGNDESLRLLIASHMNRLGEVYYRLKKYAQAEPLFERALAIRENARGPDDPDVRVTLSNLALVSAMLGDREKAVALQERSLAILEQSALGQDHPALAGELRTLAALYKSTGRDAEAEKLKQRVARIYADQQ